MMYSCCQKHFSSLWNRYTIINLIFASFTINFECVLSQFPYYDCLIKKVDCVCTLQVLCLTLLLSRYNLQFDFGILMLIRNCCPCNVVVVFFYFFFFLFFPPSLLFLDLAVILCFLIFSVSVALKIWHSVYFLLNIYMCICVCTL